MRSLVSRLKLVAGGPGTGSSAGGGIFGRARTDFAGPSIRQQKYATKSRVDSGGRTRDTEQPFCVGWICADEP